MREQGITLTEFHKGLRPYDDTVTNQEMLTDCFNLIPRAQGLVSVPDISHPITAVSVNHPWPQIFLGHKHWVCCTQDKIYTINANWSLTLQLDLDIYYNSFPNAPKETWHFADFFDYVVLTNGGVTVVYNPDTTIWEYNDGTTLPTLGTVLNFKGQIIGSGRDTVVGDPKTVFGETTSNFLMWGGIGSANFVVDQSNVKGYRPMPWTGEVYKIMALGDNIVVYGASGIAICKFNNTVLGIVKLLKYGIASRDAAGGDDETQVFIDTEGNLRKITPESISEPMYKEFFSTMLGREIVVTHNSLQNEFYITDGVRSFVLTKQGLGETFQAPTTLDINAGILVGVYTDLTDTTASIVTDSLDFGTSASKTIDIVEVGCNTTLDVEVAISYKLNHKSTFQTTPWRTTNPNGIVVVPINGVEFKIHIRCSSYSNLKINFITLRVKFDDKRFIRGTSNANKTSA
jgi:hypothetical protein